MRIDEQEALLCTLVIKMNDDLEHLRKLLSKVRGGKAIDEQYLLKILRNFNHAPNKG